MCTSFRLTAEDKSVVVGRSYESHEVLDAKITMIPRGFRGASIGPNNTEGKTWTSKYGVVGVDAFGIAEMMSDGMNEKGLYAGLQLMPGFCEYTPSDQAISEKSMVVCHVAAYVLGTSATVGEACEAMNEVTLWSDVPHHNPLAPPMHITLHDKSGDSAVLEWRQGEMIVHENPIGVVCDAPYFDWHVDNLRNYLNLSTLNPNSSTINGVEVKAMWQGAGMQGLPGDWSSPSRFVRTTSYISHLRPIATGKELEKSAFHLLNAFDIPKGLIRGDEQVANDAFTPWSSMSNLTDLRYAIRTYGNSVPHLVDLKNVDFDRSEPVEIPLPEEEHFVTLSL